MAKRSVYRQFPNVSICLEEKIIRRRKEQKISQIALAEKANLTRNCIQQLECREHLPLPSTIFKLVKALNFSAAEASEFWAELDAAYDQDRAVQEGIDKAHEAEKWTES